MNMTSGDAARSVFTATPSGQTIGTIRKGKAYDNYSIKPTQAAVFPD